jgi:hypothetical protein
MSAQKEPEFFSRDAVFEQGLEWYRSLFSQARPDQMCGEASTTYARWPHLPNVPERIMESLPNARFIYIMRHPVDRAYSHYCQHMRLGVTMTFEEALKRDAIYVDCGMYLMQIERYLRYFPRDAFLFLFSAELRKDPHSVLRSVQEFLGLPVLDLVQDEPVTANPTTSAHYIREHTTGQLRRLPGVSALADRTPQAWRDAFYALIRRSPVGRWLAAQHRTAPMLPETRRRLLALFEGPNRALGEFLGRDLSHWSS